MAITAEELTQVEQQVAAWPVASNTVMIDRALLTRMAASLREKVARAALQEMLGWLYEHRESHLSWLRHFESDPEYKCSRCTPELIRSVGNAEEQRATVARYDRMIATISALFSGAEVESGRDGR